MINELLVYTDINTNRCLYAIDVVIKTHAGIQYEITTNKELFLSYNGPKLQYASVVIDQNSFYITPNQLITENNIKHFVPSVGTWKGYPALFAQEQARLNHISFDIFSASFYLLSRYEEYTNADVDKHKRYKATCSLAFKNNFLHLPIVNIWSVLLREEIMNQYPQLAFQKRTYQFTPSYDIDIAYAYKGRSLKRNLAGTFRDLTNKNWRGVKERFKVLSNIINDPYDSFEYQFQLQKQYQIQPIYFFLVGEYGKYDKNINPSKYKPYAKLIENIGKHCQIGIHPSYASNGRKDKLIEEIKTLSEASGLPISISRQHYLKMSLPDTYIKLARLGITDDYTMGYPSEIGFRAGTCTPYPFFDLNGNKTLPLTVHAFQVMDGTLKDYMKLTPHQSIEKIKKIIDEVRKVDGQFITVWHNQSLSVGKQWSPEWLNLYEQILEYASQ